jgi:hypothetical protein
MAQTEQANEHYSKQDYVGNEHGDDISFAAIGVEYSTAAL